MRTIRMYLITITILVFVIQGRAQVHQQGTAALDVAIAKTGVGISGGLAFNRNFSEQAYLQGRVLAEFGRMYNFKYAQYGADLLAFYNPFFISDYVQLNAGAGLTGGREAVKGTGKGGTSSGSWTFGIKAAVEVEAFVSDQVGFILSGRQAYLVKKGLGSSYYEVGIGLRIFLNNYY